MTERPGISETDEKVKQIKNLIEIARGAVLLKKFKIAEQALHDATEIANSVK